MKTMIAALVLAILATGCWNPFAPSPDPTLEVRAFEGEHMVTLRKDDTTTTQVLVRHRFDDPAGLAGLEVVIDGADIPRRTYNASSLAGNQRPRFKVPDTGVVSVRARIVQNGNTVAEVSGQWWLKPEIQWAVEVDRAPFPMGNGSTDIEKPRCRWFTCRFVWGEPIAEAARNYEREALWVTVHGYNPNECLDVC